MKRLFGYLPKSLSGLLFVVLGIGLLLGAALLLWPAPAPAVPPPQAVAAAAQALPAYTQIDATRHVVMGQSSTTTGVFTDTAQVQGLLLLAALKKGEAITEVNAVAAPADAWLLTVPVSNTLQALAAGDAVYLVGGAEPPVPAVILAVGAESVEVAAAPAEGARLAAWLAAGERVILARPVVP